MEAEEGSNSAQKLPMPSLEGRREAQEPQFWDRHARFPRRLIGLLVQRLEGGGRQRRCPRFPYDSYVPLLREQPHGGDAETPPPTPGGERSLSHESRPAAVPGPGAASRGLRDSANRPRVNPAGAPPSQMLGGPSSSGFLSPLGPADSPAGSGAGLLRLDKNTRPRRKQDGPMGSDVTGDPSLSPLLALGDRWEHECEGGTHGIGEIQELPDYHGSSSLQEHTNRGKDVTADDELYDPINYSAEHESVESGGDEAWRSHPEIPPGNVHGSDDFWGSMGLAETFSFGSHRFQGAHEPQDPQPSGRLSSTMSRLSSLFNLESAQSALQSSAVDFGQGEPLEMPEEPEQAAISSSHTFSWTVPRLSGLFSRESPNAPNDSSQTAMRPKRAMRQAKCAVVDDLGKASVINVEKLYMTLVLGVPSRDIRVLDPLAPRSYPSSVFIRERAVVLSMEAVKAIVTADRVYLLAVPEVSSNPQAGESVWAAAHKLLGKEGLQAAAMARKPTGVMIPTKDHPFVADLCKRIQDSIDTLPFSLRVLEAVMAAAHTQLGGQVSSLEESVKLVLDALVMKVSRHNLEKVHSVKSQMNKLAARVEKLKEEIDKLLADDDDMRALYLKPKPAEQRSDMNPQAMHLAGYDRVCPKNARSISDVGPEHASYPHGHLSKEAGAGKPRRHTASVRFSDAEHRGELHEAPQQMQYPAGHVRDLPWVSGGPHASSGTNPDVSKKPSEGSEKLSGRSRVRSSVQSRSTKGLPKGTNAARNTSNMRKTKSDVHLLGKAGWDLPSRTPSRYHVSSVLRADSNASIALAGGRPAGGCTQGSSAKISRVRNIRSVVNNKGTLGPNAQQQPSPFPTKKPRRGHADVQEAEALLEVYMTNVEFLQSRIELLKDRIGDTQDLVNIELDSRYNELEAVNVYLNIYSVAWSFAALVVAVWGVNVCQTCPWHSESGPDSNPWLFWVTVGYIFAIQALIVVIFFTYIQVKGLSFIPAFSFFSTIEGDSAISASFTPWWSLMQDAGHRTQLDRLPHGHEQTGHGTGSCTWN